MSLGCSQGGDATLDVGSCTGPGVGWGEAHQLSTVDAWDAGVIASNRRCDGSLDSVELAPFVPEISREPEHAANSEDAHSADAATNDVWQLFRGEDRSTDPHVAQNDDDRASKYEDPGPDPVPFQAQPDFERAAWIARATLARGLRMTI